MKKLISAGVVSLGLICAAAPSTAVEGMFTPEQFPELTNKLKKAGIKIKPESLSDLTGFPMGAVVSLGGVFCFLCITRRLGYHQPPLCARLYSI